MNERWGHPDMTLADVEFEHSTECAALAWERDSARATAARLEAENAQLRALLQVVDIRVVQGLGTSSIRFRDSFHAVGLLERFARSGVLDER